MLRPSKHGAGFFNGLLGVDIVLVRRLLSQRRIALRFSDHAFIEARKDGLTTVDLRAASEHGEVIEDYGARALLLHFTAHDRLPYHIVLEYGRGRVASVVTAYVPDAKEWEPDWKTRRKRKRR
jgi:hypothetical protein